MKQPSKDSLKRAIDIIGEMKLPASERFIHIIGFALDKLKQELSIKKLGNDVTPKAPCEKCGEPAPFFLMFCAECEGGELRKEVAELRAELREANKEIDRLESLG